MNLHAAVVVALLVHLNPHPSPVKSAAQYTLRVDSADVSGWSVEIRLRTMTDTFRLAMAAHPEYDDRYWRYVKDFTVSTGSFTKVDSAVWQIVAQRGIVTVRYRVALPPSPSPRAAWRPFLTSTGGLVGGPHAFMYLIGAERMPVMVTLDLPASWRIATGLTRTADPHSFTAAGAAALADSPILVGRLREWRFVEGGLSHRVFYWPLPDAVPFDTLAFVSSVRQTVHQALALFGHAPYHEYTFLFEDGAYGALEHRNSVTLGAPSKDLGSDPHALLVETAHEFFHTWNLMAMQPSEYREIDYRTQPPVSSLWFSEGLTMLYADLLMRRAGFQLHDSTRTAHLERLLTSYGNNPAYTRFSAEAVSRVAYNAAPGALGDYSASTHLQGELIGTMLDLVIRDATRDRRSMDDVMRLLFDRGSRIDAASIEQAVETVCGCGVAVFFDTYVRNAGTLDFDRYFGLIGLRTTVIPAPAVSNAEPARGGRIERATVRIDSVPDANAQQRLLRDSWLNPRTASTAPGFSSEDKSPRSSKPR